MQNQPYVPDGEQIHTIDIRQIATNNYRSEEEFDEASLQELAGDIARNGLLQPLIVRELKASSFRYELISGERRLRACKLNGYSTLGAIIKNVDDNTARIMRLSENLHRKDVHPLNEATVYLQLALMGYSAKEVARQVSKTEAFVVSRLILNELSPYWKELFYKKGINEKTAMILARLSGENQGRMEKLFPRKNIEEKGVICRSFSYNSVNDVINTKLFQNLSGSDFPKDDPMLYPQAGSCLQCPKRSGYNQLLFAEISNVDFCMDTPCFEKKKGLYFERQKQKLLSEGRPLLQLSTHYSEQPGLLHKSEVEILSETDPLPEDARKVIVANGDQVGKILNVRIKQTTGNGLLKTIEGNEKRNERIEAEKREKQFRELLSASITDLLSESLQNRDAATYGKILDFLIIERIGNGQSQAFLDHFSARYGWPRIDRSLVESRSGMIATCVASTPTRRKVELLVDLFVYAKALDENKGKLLSMAKAIGIDIEAIGKLSGLGDHSALHAPQTSTSKDAMHAA